MNTEVTSAYDMIIKWKNAEILRLRTELDAYKEALTPSEATLQAYEYQFETSETGTDEYGYECERWMNVSWAAIEEIMEAIRKRAQDTLAKATP